MIEHSKNLESLHELAAEVAKNVTASPGNAQQYTQTYYLTYGRKQLTIYVRPGEANTLIRNVNDETHKKDDETTILYLAAKMVIQKLAKEQGDVIEYALRTSVDRIRDWARTTGNEIFHWSNTSVEQDQSGETHDFRVTIDPPAQ